MSKEVIWQSSWKSPSNIALVKYWGKHDRQLPNNPSVSFTLDEAHTVTHLEVSEIEEPNGEVSFEFYFEGKESEAFSKRIGKFLRSIVGEMAWLKKHHLVIESSNSFPHSTGIASSASAMSALCLCLVEVEQNVNDRFYNEPEFLQRASYFSRLASGSAARSVFPTLAIWGASMASTESSDLFAIPASAEVNPIFESFHDDILIVSSKEKSVSSTAGHQLMEDNRFAEVRYRQAEQNLEALMLAMKLGDIDQFIEIVEEEALTLHALMMTSKPSFILMHPNTLEMINRIRAYRAETGVPVCFTLDAGPNIHLLYPHSEEKKVSKFVKDQLLELCEDNFMLRDKVGKGPVKI